MPTFFGVLTHSCRLTRKELFEKNVARSSLFAAVPALLPCRPPALPVAALPTCLSKRGPRPRCRNIGVAQNVYRGDGPKAKHSWQPNRL